MVARTTGSGNIPEGALERVRAQVWALVLALNCAGQTLGLVGMANTSTTFTCLWLLDKYADFHMEMKWNGWVLLLLMSCAVWRASLWLHTHPGHIVSMFSGV